MEGKAPTAGKVVYFRAPSDPVWKKCYRELPPTGFYYFVDGNLDRASDALPLDAFLSQRLRREQVRIKNYDGDMFWVPATFVRVVDEDGAA